MAGRKPINPENKTSQFVAFLLSERDKQRLNEAAMIENLPVSILVRKLVKDYLDQLDRDFVTADLLFGGKEDGK